MQPGEPAGRRGSIDAVDVGSWFEEAELRPCPRCGERRLLPTPGGDELHCLDCGVIFAGADGAHEPPASEAPVSRTERARRTLRELRAEAEAVQAHARLQGRRAARNLRRPKE